ncbi:somatostatin receptor type 5-like [Branchiostoma lanceolatum]|uniref:somatostatin receptor type 5-like n=1 Tax=Branchiostoma lanceolatum TaxID=7740 RepID=UPI003453EC98
MDMWTGNWSFVNGTASAGVPYALELTSDIVTTIMTIAPVVYGTVTVVGLLGNLLVIYVLLCHTREKDATNCYTLNLALADALFLLGVPFSLASNAMGRWVFGGAMCKIVLVLDALNMFSSVFNLAVLSVDRYLATVRANSHTHLRRRKVVTAVCLSVWVAAFLLTIPVMAIGDAFLLEDGNHVCILNWPDDESLFKVFISYTFIVGFVLPVAVISVSYLSVVRHLRRNTSAHPAVAKVSIKMRREVAKKVSAMIVAFVVCWLPFHVCQLLNLTIDLPPTPTVLVLFHLSLAMSYVKTCVNPVIYVFMSQKFRGSLRAALRLDRAKPAGRMYVHERANVALRRLEIPGLFHEEKCEVNVETAV